MKNSNQLSSRRDINVGHILHYFQDLLYQAESMFLQNVYSAQLSFVRRPCNLYPSNVINDITMYRYIMFNSGFSNPRCLWQCLWQKKCQTWLYKTFSQTYCMEQSRHKPKRGLLCCSPPLQTPKIYIFIYLCLRLIDITHLVIYTSAKTSHWIWFMTSTLKFWKK